MQDDVLKRRTDVDGPSWTYAAADEIADFGARQSRLEIIISQMGQRVPTGIPAVAVIAV